MGGNWKIFKGKTVCVYFYIALYLVKWTNSFYSIGAWLQRRSWISDISLFKRKRHTKSVYVPCGKITEGWSSDCGRNNGFVTISILFCCQKNKLKRTRNMCLYIYRRFRDVTTKYCPRNIKEAKVTVDTAILQKQRNCVERITPKMAKRGIVRCHLENNNLMQFQQQQVKNLTVFNIYFQYFFNVGYQFCSHFSRWPTVGPRRFTWFK